MPSTVVREALARANVDLSIIADLLALKQNTNRRPAKPVCTHVVMSKLHGPEHRCGTCYRVPSIGFVYVCEQDQAHSTPHATSTTNRLPKGKKRRTLVELELLGLSESVIKTAAAGPYTAVQLETLIAQKLNVRKVIEATQDKEKIGEYYHCLLGVISMKPVLQFIH